MVRLQFSCVENCGGSLDGGGSSPVSNVMAGAGNWDELAGSGVVTGDVEDDDGGEADGDGGDADGDGDEADDDGEEARDSDDSSVDDAEAESSSQGAVTVSVEAPSLRHAS
jgi:hypothetical protein